MRPKQDALRRIARVTGLAGAPLDRDVRVEFESAMGYDFGRVRVHTDAIAGASAEAVDALAYTLGSHLVFAPDQYAPRTERGRRLLAHELTHAIQQGMARPSQIDGLSVMPPEHRSEREAQRVSLGELPTATTVSPVAIARATPGAEEAIGIPAAGRASATALDIEFHAFIPGSLGRPFSSFPHARDLKNQATFQKDVAAVTSPNSWKPEPTKTESDVTEPGSARKVWFYSTDERGFGGGSHRVGFTGSVSVTDIGRLGSGSKIFTHSCNASHRVRSTDTGYLTSANETGSVEGPFSKTAPVKEDYERRSDSAAESTVQTGAQAAYAFMPTVSPDIDYDVAFTFTRKPGGIEVSSVIDHNHFPFYEILINGTRHWVFASPHTGPTFTNLNSTSTDSGKPQTF